MAAQVRTMHWLFWLTSALMIGIGAVVEGLLASEWFSSSAKPDVFLFTILLLPVASVAYSLRSMHTPMSELEATFPVTPVQLMVARIGTILLYDLLLALLFYGILVMTGTSGEFGSNTTLLITDLLLPICLSAFAALAAMLRFGTWYQYRGCARSGCHPVFRWREAWRISIVQRIRVRTLACKQACCC